MGSTAGKATKECTITANENVKCQMSRRICWIRRV